jgi:hypothetical protein
MYKNHLLLLIGIICNQYATTRTNDNQKILGRNSESGNCNSCNQSLIEMRIYSAELEKRIKGLMDELARWMKLYEASVIEKATSSERHTKELIELKAKYCTLVHRFEK